jgi:hypothetical protein
MVVVEIPVEAASSARVVLEALVVVLPASTRSRSLPLTVAVPELVVEVSLASARTDAS